MVYGGQNLLMTNKGVLECLWRNLEKNFSY